jgi:hypothetical protein
MSEIKFVPKLNNILLQVIVSVLALISMSVKLICTSYVSSHHFIINFHYKKNLIYSTITMLILDNKILHLYVPKPYVCI